MLKISGEALQGHKGFGVEPKVRPLPKLSCPSMFSAANQAGCTCSVWLEQAVLLMSLLRMCSVLCSARQRMEVALCCVASF